MARDDERDERDERDDRDRDRDERDRDRDERDRDERAGRYGRRRDRDDAPLTREELKRKLKLPAIFLLIVGILYLLAAGSSLVYGLVYLDQQWEKEMADAQAQQPQRDPRAAQAAQDMMKAMKPLAMVTTGVIHGGGALLSLFVIFGATKMMSGSSRGWGMAAAIIAILPLNCYVWVFGIGIGIWALVVLSNPQVKAAFAAGGGRESVDEDREDRRDRDDDDRRD